nr:hypothetical protein Q903MT_gene1309 [Picea sitchensis]
MFYPVTHCFPLPPSPLAASVLPFLPSDEDLLIRPDLICERWGSISLSLPKTS